MRNQHSTDYQPLPPPVAFMVDAADGWLMLGSGSDALAELESVPRALRHDPRVLARECKAAHAAGDYRRSLRTSRELCRLLPEAAVAWVCQANALRETDGVRAAADLLLSVADRFPDEPVPRYNLACCLAQLHDWDQASQWLLSAFEASEDDQLKGLALLDPDLAPLWGKIGKTCALAILSSDRED